MSARPKNAAPATISGLFKYLFAAATTTTNNTHQKESPVSHDAREVEGRGEEEKSAPINPRIIQIGREVLHEEVAVEPAEDAEDFEALFCGPHVEGDEGLIHEVS